MSNVIILILVYLLQNAHGKCLNSNSDIYQAMISTTVEPSLENITWKDNYYNISTALFPLPSHWSKRSHALYIRVWVHFLNASNTGIDFSKTLKFTWSESCIYVVIEPVATTILSHGTIVLQLATASLHITLPPFCSKVNEDAVKERMLSFITKLQDLAISPNVSDPRLNTASCILHGHDNDRLELSTWQKGLYGYLANSPAVASFLATPFLLTIRNKETEGKTEIRNKETEGKTQYGF
ncbi:uncharacterized protein LOC116601846 [Nematostella vectensis]|uniref:uncharacterized protein LOC116601846 n=1 Tax=Nematostella vectensis TaxID=45351 RepID=UPI00207748DA|nr:uncharacterized protein LOC116601846 [Nematostella vectensis]